MVEFTNAYTRRRFLGGAAAAGMAAVAGWAGDEKQRRSKALIAITLDLEMSRHYPQRGMMEWDFKKGDLDDATKQYAVDAGRIAKDRGGMIHYFCVGRVLEQPDVTWLKELAADGHSIGNHTYDHVNLLATDPLQTQFRFQRAPWLVRGKSAREIIEENIRLTSVALSERCQLNENGFRTPGGFRDGLKDRPDLQQMLLDLGFTWISSKYPAHQSGTPMMEPSAEVYADIVRAQSDAQPFRYPSGLIEIPMSPISDVGAFRTNFWKLEWFLKAVKQAVEWAIDTGGVFDFLAHPSCLVVEDPQFATVKLICDLVRKAGDRAAVVDLATIARQTAGH